MPKSTFLSEVSFFSAVINPKSGSSGACGTTSAVKMEALLGGAMCADILESRSDGEVEEEVVGGDIVSNR